VTLLGQDITHLSRQQLRPHRRQMHMVFQDPYSSLNPRMTCGQLVGQPLELHGISKGSELGDRVQDLFDKVGLGEQLRHRFPHELSGGQRQRVGIARALSLRPNLLIADEPVSALDVSVQASILALLNRLRRELELTTIFISHDLAVVRQVSSRVVVLYLGAVVEDRPTESLFDDPQHPYTQALMEAAPKLGVRKEPGSAALSGEVPSPIERPSGCRFRTRCPLAQPVCAELEPELRGPGRADLAACHFAWLAPAANGRQRPEPSPNMGYHEADRQRE
jgi:oligopeptide transport system ATP-binding protein